MVRVPRPRWKDCGSAGRILVALIAVDLVTQDIVDAVLAKHEDYQAIRMFLIEVRDGIGYKPKEAVIDLDPAWKEAVSDVFPDTSLHMCVVHFECVVVRAIAQRTRAKRQEKLLEMVKGVACAKSEDEAERALEKVLSRRRTRVLQRLEVAQDHQAANEQLRPAHNSLPDTRLLQGQQQD